MSMNDVPALPIGTASASTVFAPLLGQAIFVGDKKYRLCQAAGAIAAAAGKVLATGLSAGLPSYSVDFPVASSNTVLGVVPIGQTGSTGTTGLVSGDYFWLQVGPGPMTANCAVTTGLVVGTALVTTTGGTVAAFTAVGSGGTVLTDATIVGHGMQATTGTTMGIRVVIPG